MNQKTAKRIRKYLRGAGINPSTARYADTGVTAHSTYRQDGLRQDGTPRIIRDVTYVTAPVRLAGGSGRALYRTVKRQYKEARI